MAEQLPPITSSYVGDLFALWNGLEAMNRCKIQLQLTTDNGDLWRGAGFISFEASYPDANGSDLRFQKAHYFYEPGRDGDFLAFCYQSLALFSSKLVPFGEV
jgi:hypothetical protein